jgi:hypothetical protein
MSYLSLGIANLTDHIFGFYLALTASAMIGMGCAIGESTIIGFL